MGGKLEQLRDWAARNKGPIGSAFVGAWGWAEVTGCPPVYGVDIISATGVSCMLFQKVLGFIGFLLMGAGWLTPDALEKRRQILQGKLSGALPADRRDD